MFTAVFRDGPLGGQHRYLDRVEHIYRVPVVPLGIATAFSADAPLELTDTVEEYRIVGASGRMVEYRWVNPAASLREQVKRQREVIVDLRAVIAEVQEAVSC